MLHLSSAPPGLNVLHLELPTACAVGYYSVAPPGLKQRQSTRNQDAYPPPTFSASAITSSSSGGFLPNFSTYSARVGRMRSFILS